MFQRPQHLLSPLARHFHVVFVEEPVQCQNVDIMADLARKTHLPIATGERIATRAMSSIA